MLSKCLYFTAILFACTSTIGQTVSKTIPICAGTYTYSGVFQNDHSITVTITDLNNATRTVQYNFSGDNATDFQTVFKSQFASLKNPNIVCPAADLAIIGGEADYLWSKLHSLYLAALPQTFTKTIPLCGGTFTYTGQFQTDNSIKVTIQDINTAGRKIEYSYSGTNVSDFKTVFQRQFLLISPPAVVCTDNEKNTLLEEGNTLWLQLQAFRPPPQQTLAPTAGTLSIPNKIIFYANVIKNSKPEIVSSADSALVNDVQLEFNNGYIETILATIIIGGRPRVYENIYGIGFTSFENYDKLASIRLIRKNGGAFPKKESQADPNLATFTYIKLGDLLKYSPLLGVNRRDYSPADTAFRIFGGQTTTLYKEQTNRLFEAHIFSDFVGLDEDKPNGLVQTEISKRININTYQWQLFRLVYPVFKSFGIFQYITPAVTISKIEQHNRHLILQDLDSIRSNPGNNDLTLLHKDVHRYTTALDLFQYNSVSTGFDLNVIYFSNHNLKYSLYIDLGGRLGLTPVTDSATSVQSGVITKTGTTTNYTIYSMELIPQAAIVVLPEERFNFSLSYRYLIMYPTGGTFQLLQFESSDPTKYKTTHNNKLSTIELLMSLNLNQSGNSKLFGRVRFNSTIGNSNSHFAQIQVGYSTYILGNK